MSIAVFAYKTTGDVAVLVYLSHHHWREFYKLVLRAPLHAVQLAVWFGSTIDVELYLKLWFDGS